MNNPGVLQIRPFRRLWIALSLSGLGDWLSVLAFTAFAWSLADGYTEGSFTCSAGAPSASAMRSREAMS